MSRLLVRFGQSAMMGRFLLLFLLLSGVAAAQQTADEDVLSPSDVAEQAIIDDRDFLFRIIGGNDADEDDWPSMVAIAESGFGPFENRFFCGGTLVDERHVMTAAHCLFDFFGRQESASNLRVIAGIHDLSDDADHEEMIVSNIFIHPDFDIEQPSPSSDIALLELANVADASVGALFAGESEEHTGETAYIVGWGATRFENDEASDFPSILQQALVPLVSLAECNAPESYDGLIEVTQLCAGFEQGEVDSCAGDSGGPLYILVNGLPVQIGITSFGIGCAEPGFYGIYTNVSHFIPWLSDFIEVPEQSAELVAQRAAGITPDGQSSTDGLNTSERSGGAVHPLLMLLLVLAAAFRLSACSAQQIPRGTELMSDAGLTLEPNSLTERAGLDRLHLGMAAGGVEEYFSSRAQWLAPVCSTEKAAMQARGRLSQVHVCQVQAATAPGLYEWQVSRMRYVLVAGQLVRLDLKLSADSEPALAEGSLLVARLDAEFDAVDEDSGRAGDTLRWQVGQDQILLLPDQRLAFVDSRLPQKSIRPAAHDPIISDELTN